MPRSPTTPDFPDISAVLSDSDSDRPVFMHAWRDQTAQWWFLQRTSEGDEVHVNCLSSDVHAIPACGRFQHYTYQGYVEVNRDVPIHGSRDAQLDLIVQQLDHMSSRLETHEVPWNCFAFFKRTLRRNTRALRRAWCSYDIDRKTSDVIRQLSCANWHGNHEIDRIRSSAVSWMALCERSWVYR